MIKRCCVIAFASIVLAQSAAAEPQTGAPALPKPLAPPSLKPATPATAAPQSPMPSGTMSESKFLSVLYSEIARRTPQTSPAGAGEVVASFHVDASGRIDRVKIDKTSSPALAEEVKRILAAVSAPPPPGGGMDVGQTFKFH